MRITLCGSSRFRDEFVRWMDQLTMMGHVVYGLGSTRDFHGEPTDNDVKKQLDNVHKLKIANSDAVFVLNVNGYVGSSTLSEIQFARGAGKLIFFLEPKIVQPQLNVEAEVNHEVQNPTPIHDARTNENGTGNGEDRDPITKEVSKEPSKAKAVARRRSKVIRK